MNNVKRSTKRKFNSNISQYSGKTLATPINPGDQDMMILTGEHPMRIISRDRIPMSPNERARLNSLRRSCKLTTGSTNISSRDKEGDFVVKVMVHLVNTKKSDTFKTTYTRYMKLSQVEGYITIEFKNKNIKPSKIRVDNEVIYSAK